MIIIFFVPYFERHRITFFSILRTFLICFSHFGNKIFDSFTEDPTWQRENRCVIWFQKGFIKFCHSYQKTGLMIHKFNKSKIQIIFLYMILFGTTTKKQLCRIWWYLEVRLHNKPIEHPFITQSQHLTQFWLQNNAVGSLKKNPLPLLM